MRAISAMGLALLALSPTGCAKLEPVSSPQTACAVAIQEVTTLRGVPTSHVARCENMGKDADYYPLVLYAPCREDLCGSTSMGWFAVSKRTGEVFEWDVTDEKPGPRLTR